MLLENKTAILYGGGGNIGGTVARAFAREGARVFLTGRTLDTLDAIASDIVSAGGQADTAQVDATDAKRVGAHFAAVVDQTGGVDTACSAIEGMLRTLAAEVGSKGVRVCWLRSAARPKPSGPTWRSTPMVNPRALPIRITSRC